MPNASDHGFSIKGQLPGKSKPSPREMRQEQLRDLARRAHIAKPNDLVDDVSGTLPVEVVMAIRTGRPEFIKAATPRELTFDECKVLFHLIMVLMKTNQALQEHADQVGNMATTLVGNFRGLIGFAEDVGKFARFQHDQIGEADEVD